MEHQTEQKTPDVEAKPSFEEESFFEAEEVQDKIDSAYSLPGNKRNAEEEINPKQPVEAFNNARTLTKNRENLSTDTAMVAYYLEQVCLEVLGHNKEIKDKTELEKMILLLNYIVDESEKLLQKYTINKAVLDSRNNDDVRKSHRNMGLLSEVCTQTLV